MPIYERYVIWTDTGGKKTAAGLGPAYTETQAEARQGVRNWAEGVMKRNNADFKEDMSDIEFSSYEIVVRQVLEQ